MDSESVLRLIENADEETLDCILNAVFERRKSLFPDWEMIYFSLPKNNPKERKMILVQALDILMRE